MDHWNTLNIEPTTDLKIIKKAYSSRLKKTRPDQDADAYQRLREAFDWAKRYCQYMAKHAETADMPTEDTHRDPLTPGDKLNDHDENNACHLSGVVTEASEGIVDDPVAQSAPSDNTQAAAQQCEQRAYDTALKSIKQLFSAATEDECCHELASLIHGYDLINLKTRSYFEAILINELTRYEGPDMPYRLASMAAKEFHWFEEQHANIDKRQRVAYIESRLSAYRSYTDALVIPAQHGQGKEKSAAKLLLGKYQPKYFHFLRFIGYRNLTLRKYTRYFSQSVEQGTSPELHTETFFWWNKHLERSLFSLWHLLAGFVALLFIHANFSQHMPVVNASDISFVMLGGTLVFSLILWGIDCLYRRYQRLLLSYWQRIEGLAGTNFALSIIFMASVLFWREYRGVDYIGWLIPLALTASTLIFGLYGLVQMLGAAIIYSVCYHLVDVLDRYPELESFALIIGFVSYKWFLFTLNKMPKRISDYIYQHNFLFYSYAGALASALSLAYLTLYIH